MTGTAKLDSWKAQPPPDPELCKRLRQYVVEAVFAKHNKDKKPASLISIFYSVTSRINKERQLGRWPRKWKQPGKRTVDRRVNEAATKEFYEDGVPRIVAITSGIYGVNPQLFEEISKP